MITKLAVRWIIRQLRKDKQLWYVYQSNIAMTIYDNCLKYLPLRTGNGKDPSPDPLNKDYKPTLHEFCNICANETLKLFTMSTLRESKNER